MIVLVLGQLGFAYAINEVKTTAVVSAAIPTPTVVDNKQQDQNTDSSDDNGFARSEELDRSIEEANKEISALKMTSDLNNIRRQAEKMSIDFAVVRIAGVGNILNATLQFTNKSLQNIAQGDVIEDRYLVKNITPEFVQLEDKTNNKQITAPFIE